MRVFSHAVLGGFVTAALASSACSMGEPAQPELDAPRVVTFAEHIEPLLIDKCQKCHHAGGIAPFALETYDDLKAVAGVAKQKVGAREMPPWGAFDDQDCKVNHRLKDDLRLTDQQVKDFVAWVEGGMPFGDPSKRPAAATFGTEGLFDKTHAFTTKLPYEVVAGGKDDLRCFPVDPGFNEDTWIAASNVVPGDPRVVHHVLVFVDPKGEGAAKAGPDGSYPCFGGPDTSNPSLLLAWAPGVPPAYYGEDAGIKVPKGAKLVLQVHYHPHGQITAHDQTRFELKALATKPSFVSQVLLAGNAESTKDFIHLVPPSKDTFLIPANDPAHVEAMELTIPETLPGGGEVPEISLLAVGTHMHWAGVDMKIEIDRKNPTEGQPAHECLIGTPKYDFNWQRAYAYDEPMEKLPLVSPGDTLRFTCTYNNTLQNPYVRRALSEMHLASPQDIHLGETTLDEMCLGAIVAVRRATLADL